MVESALPLKIRRVDGSEVFIKDKDRLAGVMRGFYGQACYRGNGSNIAENGSSIAENGSNIAGNGSEGQQCREHSLSNQLQVNSK